MLETALSFVRTTTFLNFCLNGIILILIMLLSRRSLERIRRIMNLLEHGGYKECPHYFERSLKGTTEDCSDRVENINEKGGETL